MTVGFDLDLTLIDTRAATRAALRTADLDPAAAIDVDACLVSGAALRAEFGRRLPPEQVAPALRRFAAAFREDGLPLVRPLPGAAALLDRVRRAGRRSVVVTARRAESAASCLRAAGMAVDAIAGGLAGPDKSSAIRAHGVTVYLGDHPLDMAAAVAAGVPGIGVLTGIGTAGDLRLAGARLVLGTLAEMPAKWVG